LRGENPEPEWRNPSFFLAALNRRRPNVSQVTTTQIQNLRPTRTFTIGRKTQFGDNPLIFSRVVSGGLRARPFVSEIVPPVPVVLAAMDKFRGTASARELSEAVASGASIAKWSSDVQPLSDGGEGFRDAFDGDVVTVEVPGPLGEAVEARVTMCDTLSGLLAVLEVAEAVGRHLLVSPTSDEALAASSAGVGHLIVASTRLGAQYVLIGCGGSSASDGGLGCYQALRDAGGLSVPLTAATDVTAFFSGARRYAEQKGVDQKDLARVDEMLREARALYLVERGVDVELLERTGASGGIPGALAALGATLTSGFDAVAHAVQLESRINTASLVVTGEGRFDHGSLEGKVAVGLAALLNSRVPLLVVCGSIDDEAADIFRRRFENATLVSLVQRFGEDRAMNDVSDCLISVVVDELALGSDGRSS
jgi:glycerate kinase